MDDALGLLKTKGVGGDGDLPSDFVLRHIDIQLVRPGFLFFGFAPWLLEFFISQEVFDCGSQFTTVHQCLNSVDVLCCTETSAVGH
jgi:hypothetical protein